ncbi:zyxin [Eurytemora carolleeae]|uniref:zyxin n=1 Tax=Eurytemora carolleeae TaxID=1294199 RepID=UPI000C7868CA|nr:zyxin [Eurytemora carolleeae]|eukprot:XP_023328187.1 zyxin-like [Eurytemora affinis]
MVGLPFSTDQENTVYCPEDFTRKFAALCTVCKNPIVPKEGHTTAPRIRALDKDFHPACFKCEDCHLVLDSRIKGKECWPIRSHVLCYTCYRRRQSESEEESD